jgi:hypothetical protein
MLCAARTASTGLRPTRLLALVYELFRACFGIS